MGLGIKKSTDPPVHLLNPRPTHPPSDFSFFLDFLFSTFLGVSRQGEFENTIKIFWQKVRVSKTFPKISTKISMSVFPRLFLFYRIFGCFSAMGVQKHHKKRFTKKIVSKSLYKKIDQKSQTVFFSIFFYRVFGRFSVRGVQKHDKK